MSQSILQVALPDPEHCIRHAVVAGFASELALRQILPHSGGWGAYLEVTNLGKGKFFGIFTATARHTH